MNLEKLLSDLTDTNAARMLITELAINYVYLEPIEEFFQARDRVAGSLNLPADYETEQRFMPLQETYVEEIKAAYAYGFKAACRMLHDEMKMRG